MKIAISPNSVDPEAEFSARFGRCRYFLIADSDLDEWQDVENPAADAQGGAGTQVVQLLANLGVEAVISGRYGPNAFEALQASGMSAYLANAGSARVLAAECQAGRLKTANGPSGRGFHGSGQGRGLGQGGRSRGGRGQGGRGQGGQGQGGRGQGGQW